MRVPENRRAPDSGVSGSGNLKRGRILVVEDQEDVRGLLVAALELEGHEVEEAGNAREGLQRLQDARYDLVLSDYAMPGGTGSWMLQEAGKLGLLDHTAALIVTAHPDARELAHLDVIAKPIDLDHFLDQVRRALEPDAAQGEPGAAGGARRHQHRVELVLYVSPHSAASAQARRNLEELLSHFDLAQIKYSVCDLVRDPAAGEQDRVAFTPTLVKRYPAPRMWVLGNLREAEIVGDLLRVCGVDAKT